jgi:hypothetical protein
MAPSVEVQMQINLGGLDTVMAEMVLSIRDGIAAVEHVNCSVISALIFRRTSPPYCQSWKMYLLFWVGISGRCLHMASILW